MRSTKKRLLAFSAVSLTDIVLLLLIFFLLSSSFIVQPGIKIKLPKAVTGETNDNMQILVTITGKQVIYLNQQVTPKNELGAKIRQLLAKQQDKTVIVRADKNISLQAAVEVIDIAKLAGAQKFMIATEPGL
ncbi:MAG: biopolymer transporter ExbD [Deferribacteres bacterium]|nr:biopolymer transporter ExbD [candidate division KSB1 bacterium]MCB9501241.1 biopolymer transporter ExbD [Deferribacteres bacterium]